MTEFFATKWTYLYAILLSINMCKKKSIRCKYDTFLFYNTKAEDCNIK